MVTYQPIIIGRDLTTRKDLVVPFTDAAVYLIGGASGSGKTNLEKVVMGQLAVDESTRIFGCDGKGARKDWDLGFADRCEQWVWPREDPDCTQYMQMLRDACAEVDRRYDRPRQYPRFVVFLEEAGNQRDRVIAVGGKKGTLLQEHDQLLKMIAQTCRDANALLVISLQRPEAESLSTNVRSNSGVRICLPVDNEVTGKMVLGSIDGVTLPTGQGNAVVRMPVLGGPDRYTLIDHFPDAQWQRFCEGLPAVNGPQDAPAAPQDALRAVPTLRSEVQRIVTAPMLVSELRGQLPAHLKTGSADKLSSALRDLHIEPKRTNKGALVTPEMVEAGVTSGVTSE